MAAVETESLEQPVSAKSSDGVGAVLLLVVGEPFSVEQKDLILERIVTELSSWDVVAAKCDVEEQLGSLTARQPKGTDGPNGEKLFTLESGKLTVIVLVNPCLSTVHDSVRSFLTCPTAYRYLLYAGQAILGSGSWLLQDGVFTFTALAELFRSSDVAAALAKAIDRPVIDIGSFADGDWSEANARKLAPSTVTVRFNPPKRPEGKEEGTIQFSDFLSASLRVLSCAELLPSTEIVGNISFGRPTLYVFPGCRGDSALFGISGFSLLVNGGYGRRSCFWEFARHLNRIDALLMTHVGADNIFGVGAFLERKAHEKIYPELGVVYLNVGGTKGAAAGNNGLAHHGDHSGGLLVNLADEGAQIVDHLHHVGLAPQPCLGPTVVPINLYHKIGHGTLDMYVLNPVADSKELKDFMNGWAKNVNGCPPHGGMPASDQLSVCSLLVWKPASPREKIACILFPGNVPQTKLFEGLDRLKSIALFHGAADKSHTKSAAAPAKQPVDRKAASAPAAGKTFTDLAPTSAAVGKPAAKDATTKQPLSARAPVTKPSDSPTPPVHAKPEPKKTDGKDLKKPAETKKEEPKKDETKKDEASKVQTPRATSTPKKEVHRLAPTSKDVASAGKDSKPAKDAKPVPDYTKAAVKDVKKSEAGDDASKGKKPENESSKKSAKVEAKPSPASAKTKAAAAADTKSPTAKKAAQPKPAASPAPVGHPVDLLSHGDVPVVAAHSDDVAAAEEKVTESHEVKTVTDLLVGLDVGAPETSGQLENGEAPLVDVAETQPVTTRNIELEGDLIQPESNVDNHHDDDLIKDDVVLVDLATPEGLPDPLEVAQSGEAGQIQSEFSGVDLLNDVQGSAMEAIPDAAHEDHDSLNANGDSVIVAAPSTFDPQRDWGAPEGLPAPTNGKNPAEKEANGAAAAEKKPASKPAVDKSASATAAAKKVDSKSGFAAPAAINKRPADRLSNSIVVPKDSTSKPTEAGGAKSATGASTSRKSIDVSAREGTPVGDHRTGAKPSHDTTARKPPTNDKPTALKPVVPFHVDLTYVPCHGDLRYFDVDFFRRVRARYYVVSSNAPDVWILSLLLEGKSTWNDDDAQVTVIPTYDCSEMTAWIADNRDRMTQLKVTVAPSASRCTIQLQDQETSCSAYRLEF